jgi:hypothetical protein
MLRAVNFLRGLGSFCVETPFGMHEAPAEPRTHVSFGTPASELTLEITSNALRGRDKMAGAKRVLEHPIVFFAK